MADPVASGRGTALRKALLIALMVFGSLAIWIGSPAFWLWLTSRLQSGTQPTMGPYALMLVGVILSSVGLGKWLAALNRRYAELSEQQGTVRLHLPWHRMRGGEHERRIRPVTVLDVVMVVSVLVAALAFAVWFFVVHPAPPGVGPGGAKH